MLPEDEKYVLLALAKCLKREKAAIDLEKFLVRPLKEESVQ